MSLKVKTTKGEGVGARSLVRSTSGVEGCVGAPGWGLGRLTSKSITHMDLHKPNNKLVNVYYVTRTLFVHGRTTRKHRLTSLDLGGKAPPSPL